jgi:hypothetical protein
MDRRSCEMVGTVAFPALFPPAQTILRFFQYIPSVSIDPPLLDSLTIEHTSILTSKLHNRLLAQFTLTPILEHQPHNLPSPAAQVLR